MLLSKTQTGVRPVDNSVLVTFLSCLQRLTVKRVSPANGTLHSTIDGMRVVQVKDIIYSLHALLCVKTSRLSSPTSPTPKYLNKQLCGPASHNTSSKTASNQEELLLYALPIDETHFECFYGQRTRHQEVSCGIGLCTVWEAVTCALRSRCQGESAPQQRTVLRVPLVGHYLLQTTSKPEMTRLVD